VAGPTIDATGFHVHDYLGVTGLQGWLDRITAMYKARYGDDINVDPESPDGQWLGDWAEMLNDAEQLDLTNYNMNSPSGAVGAALSRLARLIGVTRKSAQFTTVAITLGGTPSQLIPAGSLFDNPDDPDLPPFETAADYTIGGGGTVSGQGICTESGPFSVSSGKLTRPLDVVTGWDTVTNPTAAVPGRAVETDPVLRVRMAESVAIPSQSMLDGLRAALNDLAGVDDVVVYENTANSTNARGEPAHSIHVIIDGGVAADIANAIWVKASMGCTKFGAVSDVVLDSQGNPQEMRWDVPVDLDVYITVTLNRTPNAFEVNVIKNALVAFGVETSRIGQNVPHGDLYSPINDLEITGGPGLPSIVSIHLGDAPSPTLPNDLSVAYNARPRYDTANISVVGP
jgi:uncharacterized phage protein gp47/JayE